MKIIADNTSLLFRTGKKLVNYLNPLTIKAGIYKNGKLNYTDQFKYYCSDFIAVKKDGLIWSLEAFPTHSFPSYTVFDANKNYLRQVLRSAQDNNKYSYQEGDAFIVVNFYNISKNIEQCQANAATKAVVEGNEYKFVSYVPEK